MSADFKPVKVGDLVLSVSDGSGYWVVTLADPHFEEAIAIGSASTSHDAIMAAKDFLKKLNKALPDGRATRYGKKDSK